MLWHLIVWTIFGFIAGLLTRALTPGSDPMGFVSTTLLGVAGSFVGGFLGLLVSGYPRREYKPAGLIGAIIGGVIVLLLYRQFGHSFSN